MKTLYVIPSSGRERAFYLVDIDTNQVIASHFCSGEYFAKSDLLDKREERKAQLEAHYNDEVQCEFFNRQHEASPSTFFTQQGKLRKTLKHLEY